MATASGPPGLIDTDVLIDAQRGVANATAFLSAQQSANGVWISIISAMELVAGSRNAQELTFVQQFLQRVSVVPVTSAASRLALRLMETFFLSHRLLIPDSLIAASCVKRGCVLYTRNTRHFQMIPGLTTVRPY